MATECTEVFLGGSCVSAGGIPTFWWPLSSIWDWCHGGHRCSLCVFVCMYTHWEDIWWLCRATVFSLCGLRTSLLYQRRRHHCRIKITGPMRNMPLRIIAVPIGHRITILLALRTHQTLTFISMGRNSCIRCKFLVLWSPLFCIYFLIQIE
jgi:hypothetical protein